MKPCKSCKEAKPLSDFRPRKTPTGVYLTATCKVCEYERHKIYLNTSGIRQRIRDKSYLKDPIKHLITQRLNSWRSKTEGSDLTVEYLLALWVKQAGLCYYTQEKLIPEGGRGTNKPNQLSASLDRLNPELGYNQKNVVWCSFRANTMKGNLTEQHFYELIQDILLVHRQS